MKTDTIIVSATVPFNVLSIPLAYELDGKTVFLTKNKRLVSMDTHEYMKKCQDKDDAKALNVANIRFQAAKKDKPGILSYSYKVEVDDKGDIARSSVLVNDQAYGVFFTDCTFAEVNGTVAEVNGLPVTTSPLIKVKYLNKEKKNISVSTKDKLVIANVINDMKLPELRNVAALLAIPCKDKNHEELFAVLADFGTGAVYKVDNMKLFKDTYVDKINKSAELTIAINKGIEFSIIRNTPKGTQSQFFFKDGLIGYDKEAVTVFFRNDEDQLRALKMSVKMEEEKNGVSTLPEVIKTESKAHDSEDMNVMREALAPLVKSDSNPDGPFDIGKKQLYQVSKEDIKAAYRKYVLKQE